MLNRNEKHKGNISHKFLLYGVQLDQWNQDNEDDKFRRQIKMETK